MFIQDFLLMIDIIHLTTVVIKKPTGLVNLKILKTLMEFYSRPMSKQSGTWSTNPMNILKHKLLPFSIT